MAGLLLLVAACSKDKDIDTPAVLTPINATLKVDRVWSASVPDKGAKVLRLGLGLAAEGNRVYAAGYKGEVIAFDLASGRSVWRTKTKAPISGGPAASGDLVVSRHERGRGHCAHGGGREDPLEGPAEWRDPRGTRDLGPCGRRAHRRWKAARPFSEGRT